jgi:hypothetical protein
MNTVTSVLLISLIHYLYDFFSYSPTINISSNAYKNNINLNTDILDIINTIEDTEAEDTEVEDTVPAEDNNVNMENELDNFLKNIT